MTISRSALGSRPIVVLALVLTAALLVSGCGDDDGRGPDSTSPSVADAPPEGKELDALCGAVADLTESGVWIVDASRLDQEDAGGRQVFGSDFVAATEDLQAVVTALARIRELGTRELQLTASILEAPAQPALVRLEDADETSPMSIDRAAASPVVADLLERADVIGGLADLAAPICRSGG